MGNRCLLEDMKDFIRLSIAMTNAQGKIVAMASWLRRMEGFV